MYRKKLLGTLCASMLIVSISLGSVFQLVNAVPSFGSDVQVDSNGSDQELPSIAVFNPRCAGCQSIIHAVWEDYRNGNWNIYYKRSEDGGKTFGNLLRVNDDTTGEQYPQRQPDIAVDYDGNAHVVWSDERDPTWNDKTQIYYAKLAFGASSFGTNVRVSQWSGSTPFLGFFMFKAEPSIATDFQSTCRVHVSWYLYESNGISSVMHGVFYDRSTNCGSSFGTDQQLDLYGYEPSIAVDSSDNPHIAFADLNGKIKHIKSSNGGSSFGSSTFVTDGQATVSFEPTIAVYPDPSDDIHVAWEDHRNVLSNSNYDIYYSKSTNGGTSFSTNINVISDMYNRGQGMPSIGVDELGNPHVAWTDFRNDQDGWWASGGGIDTKNDADIYYAESTNGGTTFPTNTRVNDDSPVSGYDKEQSYPVVAVTGGIATSEIVHIVWMDERNTDFDIYYSRYIPDPDIYYRGGLIGGQSEVKICTDTKTTVQWRPSVAVDGTKVHVVWQDADDNDNDIYYRYFDGTSWQLVEEISSDSGTEAQEYPDIAVDGTKVHVVWQDKGDSDWDIYYRYFDGSSWQSEVEISSDSGTEDQLHPRIAVYSGKVHVVWQEEEIVQQVSWWDIYYRYYDGSSWQTEMELSSDNNYWDIQNAPDVAVDGTKVHAVWMDTKGGDNDIYYRYYDGSTWQTELDLTPDVNYAQYTPEIAADTGKVHVVWVDSTDSDADIYYRYYDGSSWQTALELSSDSGTETQGGTEIAADNGKVHVIWGDGGGGDRDIYYRYHDGTSWQTEQEISTDAGSEVQYSGSVAVDSTGSKVHAVWTDLEQLSWDIIYRYYDGSSWASEKEISMDVGKGNRIAPSVAVDGDKVHVVCVDYTDGGDTDPDIYYTYYDGSSWQSVQELSSDTGSEYQYSPSVAAESGKVHVVWQDKGDGDYDIYYRYYNGASWQTEQEISSDSGTEDQEHPDIAVDGTKVHVVWQDEGDGDWDIYYRYYDGSSWQTEEEISSDSGTEDQEHPAIAVDSGKVHVVWEDQGGGDRDIYYRNHNGVSWQTEVEISSDSGTEDQYVPAIAFDGTKIHVIWADKQGSDADIYYRNHNGASWQTEQEISTDSANEWQMYPSISAESGKVHVVWQDEGDGDWDIYHRYYDGSTWQTEAEISSDSGTEDQYFPDAAEDNEKVSIVWLDEVSSAGNTRDIHYRSLFAARSWRTEREISTDTTNNEWQFSPSVAADGYKVHMVWSDWGDGDADIKYRYYDGSSWQSEMELSLDAGTEWQVQPAIAVDGTKVHVVWADKGDGDYDIYYRYYNGVSWQNEVQISSDSGTEWQCQPTIAVDSGKVHVAWIDRGDGDWDIKYRLYDSGWGTEAEVSSDSGTEWQMNPDIAVDGTKVHVVWDDFGDGDWDIKYRLYDSGWGTEAEVSSDSGTENQGRPSIAVNSGKVHVVWDDFGDGDWDIKYRLYDSGWGTEAEVSSDSGTEDQWDPTIAVDGTKVHVAWVDTGGGDADIYYRYYDGSTWQTEVEISSDSGTEEQYSTAIAVGNSNVYIVWEDWQS